jgi:PAP2 superfamily.
MNTIDSVYTLDDRVFLALNGDLGNTADSIFWFASGIYQWIPLYLLILFFIYRKFGWKTMLWSLVFIVVATVVADQICNIAKYGLKKLRPSHDPDLAGMVHIVKGYKGGLYGTFSAHAATCFTIAAFTSRLFQNTYYTIFIYLWCVFVAYSRIYLGVHFPLDLFLGGITGYLSGWMAYRIFDRKIKGRIRVCL